ncbi:GMC family oxidoreductase [Kerstersia gyiorum]|uniref:Choline dehydrogenase n=2 Tax=Kerstersia gyiorum TaxID=206506 RepID=A0A4Q7MQ56_9BURK|nr:FAD-dependent oxidoreductase [Kerstersia gyiorum]MCR4159449.1 FAD-dependent oxidoreductase [Kerstersia gyiorum]RZS70390.1 choline dehydrogenase [Kerstersia gyiorum]
MAEQQQGMHFGRRRFIKTAGIASGTLMVGGVLGAKVNAAEDRDGSFDYIIVGAGSAGCVLANRLTEDSDVRVLLIEAGGPDDSEKISTPLRLIELWHTPYDWAYETVPQRHAHDRKLFWPRGKTLGGSSSLNGMIYVRGHASVYDAWAEQGNAGWRYADVLPYFKKSEDYEGGASEYHGKGGPLHVTVNYTPHPVTKAIVDAAVEAGHPYNPDHNGKEILGAGFNHLNTRDGKRASTAVAFLRPALERPNLSLITNARVQRLTLDGKRCTGLVYEQQGKLHEVRAQKEVVLSGGTIESPRVLMLSGVGDKAHLDEVGIPVVHHLPGVGKNLHDHMLVPVVYESLQPIPDLGGNPAITPLHGQLFAKTRPELPGPDMQPLFFNVPYYTPEQSGPDNAFTLCAACVMPTSRGELRLSGPGVDDPLLLDPNVLATAQDINTLVASVKMMREIASQPALAPWRGREVYPGAEVQTDEALADYCRSAIVSYHHQVGTCAMGQGPQAVVDSRLKVHGLEGVRVVDASIIPMVPSGNTNAPVIMIAEKAADMIKADARG